MDFQGLTETRNYSVVLEHLNADLPAVVNMELTSKRGQPGHGAAHERHGYHGELPKNAGAHSDHNQQAGHSVAMFRDKFWLSLLLTLPLVFGLDDVQHWLGYRAPSFPGSGLIPAILGTIVLVYGGSVFIQGAWRELSAHRPGMMSLIS